MLFTLCGIIVCALQQEMWDTDEKEVLALAKDRNQISEQQI